jgi:hypothetical protein
VGEEAGEERERQRERGGGVQREEMSRRLGWQRVIGGGGERGV